VGCFQPKYKLCVELLRICAPVLRMLSLSAAQRRVVAHVSRVLSHMCACADQGGGVHGNAILSRYNLSDVRVVQHRYANGLIGGWQERPKTSFSSVHREGKTRHDLQRLWACFLNSVTRGTNSCAERVYSLSETQ